MVWWCWAHRRWIEGRSQTRSYDPAMQDDERGQYPREPPSSGQLSRDDCAPYDHSVSLDRAATSLRSRSMRWLIGLSLWAMLASQWVAQLHEVAHYDSAPTSVRAAETQAMPSASPTSWGRYALEVGATHDPGSALCRLIHQLAQASVAPTSPVIAFEPPALPAPITVLSFGQPVALADAYSARAPPALA